jgi:hypothetical protein
MTDEHDLTPTGADPRSADEADENESADDLPLASGSMAFAVGAEAETDDAPTAADDAVDDADAVDAFSYDQFAQGLQALVPTDPALDVEAALAAINVSTLTAAEAPPASAPILYAPALPMPPVQRLKRGSLPSVVPAVSLIALGIWLMVQTTTDTPIDLRLVVIAGVGGLLVTLLAAWLAWGRWSRGLLFIALLIAGIGGVLAAGLVPGGLDLTRAYPLLITAGGLAAALSALLGRPFDRRVLTAGVITALAGGLGLLITNGFLPGDWSVEAARLWPIPVVLIAAIWLAPLLLRRRSR